MNNLHVVSAGVSAKPMLSMDQTFLNPDNGEVQIAGWGPCFDKHFSGTVVLGVARPLRRRIIRAPMIGESVHCRKIFTPLEAEGAHFASMIDLWAMLRLQGRGEPGELLIGRDNIINTFHEGKSLIPGASFRRGKGWWFYAYQRATPRKDEGAWHDGDQVLFRGM